MTRHPMHHPRNSQIRNWSVIKHVEGHTAEPYELIWAYRGPNGVEVTWKFFKTLKAANAFAEDLVNAVLNADGTEKKEQ